MEKIKNMSNYELGVIAKAFVECGTCERCIDCPCENVLCGISNFESAREFFAKEVAKRLMESK